MDIIHLLIYDCCFVSCSAAQVDLYTITYPYGSSNKNEFDPSLGSHDAFLMVDRYIFVQVIERQNYTNSVNVSLAVIITCVSFLS